MLDRQAFRHRKWPAKAISEWPLRTALCLLERYKLPLETLVQVGWWRFRTSWEATAHARCAHGQGIRGFLHRSQRIKNRELSAKIGQIKNAFLPGGTHRTRISSNQTLAVDA